MKGLYFRKNTPDDELIAGLWLIKRDASIVSLDVDASFLTFDSFAALFDALSMRRPGLSEVRLRGVPGDCKGAKPEKTRSDRRDYANETVWICSDKLCGRACA